VLLRARERAGDGASRQMARSIALHKAADQPADK
jgi:hypothetical protein